MKKAVLLAMVDEGDQAQRISFRPDYPGDISGDMASACWQIRALDALCAYCVENISYDLHKLVGHDEADVSISYRKAKSEVDAIVRLPYATDAGELLEQHIAQGKEMLVLLCERSSYTSEGMETFVLQVYRDNPIIAPQEPVVMVDTVSGADAMRLYEIQFDYGLDRETLRRQQEALSGYAPFAGQDVAALSESERAMLLCGTLRDTCQATDLPGHDSIYSALIEGKADSRGFALACVALCRQLGLGFEMITGEYLGEEHSWNLVEVNGYPYHLDPYIFALQGPEAGFLLNDEAAWGPYRWDYFSTPNCDGPVLSFADEKN